ncbi:phosphohydrolase [Nocardiopsis sp. TSRI0078]|uniref:HD domain-containing protein n=1 Tax=unclassified Nocardiopsis TaxID=2649073 RepID=UPI00093FBF23|nr:HD domain-containing protein [Nocardiopsis sp. TSRI0078]OKI13079.1 phosphohydrolase [Nocardiopsis sp. TSRI0078]
MQIPTDEEIRSLHLEHAPTREAFDLVYTHCRIVCDLAERVVRANDLPVDADLVRAGCLLHDIGVYRLFDGSGGLDHARYVRHGVLGHGLLAGEGYPEALCRFCSHHTGVGITRDDVHLQGLPIPVDDYLPATPEEEVVMYADKFHSKADPPVFLTAGAYTRKVGRFGPDKAALFTAMVDRFGEPDVTEVARGYGHTVLD